MRVLRRDCKRGESSVGKGHRTRTGHLLVMTPGTGRFGVGSRKYKVENVGGKSVLTFSEVSTGAGSEG